MEQQDERVWSLDEENGFTMKSMYLDLCPLVVSYPGECVWNSLIQLTVSFFMWELLWDRALMIDNLILRGMMIPNQCCLCTSAAESSRHLFVHCLWVEPIWSYFLV